MVGHEKAFVKATIYSDRFVRFKITASTLSATPQIKAMSSASGLLRPVGNLSQRMICLAICAVAICAVARYAVEICAVAICAIVICAIVICAIEIQGLEQFWAQCTTAGSFEPWAMKPARLCTKSPFCHHHQHHSHHYLQTVPINMIVL